MAIKECVNCGSEFIGKTERSRFCKNSCRTRYYEKIRMERDKDAFLEKKREIDRNCQRKWRSENLERAKQLSRESARKWRSENPEKYKQFRRQYYQKNCEAIKEKGMAYRLNNPESCAASGKRYYQKNKEKILLKRKLYYELNRDDLLLAMRERHNSKSAAASMLEVAASMILLNERGNNHETE